MAIQEQSTTVYYAPTKGRRYFSKSYAIKAEAKAIIYKHFPQINENGIDWQEQSGESFDIEIHRQHYYEKRHAQLCRAIKNRMQRK